MDKVSRGLTYILCALAMIWAALDITETIMRRTAKAKPEPPPIEWSNWQVVLCVSDDPPPARMCDELNRGELVVSGGTSFICKRDEIGTYAWRCDPPCERKAGNLGVREDGVVVWRELK